MSSDQEKAVISEVLDGNVEQYRNLVERYHKGLIQHLYRLTYDGTQAEDLAQEAFIQAYNKLSQYDNQYAFSTWLYKIADNLAYRNTNKIKFTSDINKIENTVADDQPALSEKIDTAITEQAVREAVQALEPTYKQVVSLYYWDNFSYEDIATIVDRPIGTVKTWLYRAKEQLRKDLYGQI